MALQRVKTWIKSFQQKETKVDAKIDPENKNCKWDYKVVQLISQQPSADATGDSKKLGGTMSPEALKSQFPEHYDVGDGRKQLNDFLLMLGEDGWELVQFHNLFDLPLMTLKRKKIEPNNSTDNQ